VAIDINFLIHKETLGIQKCFRVGIIIILEGGVVLPPECEISGYRLIPL
jgi:hypothetical protein